MSSQKVTLSKPKKTRKKVEAFNPILDAPEPKHGWELRWLAMGGQKRHIKDEVDFSYLEEARKSGLTPVPAYEGNYFRYPKLAEFVKHGVYIYKDLMLCERPIIEPYKIYWQLEEPTEAPKISWWNKLKLLFRKIKNETKV